MNDSRIDLGRGVWIRTDDRGRHTLYVGQSAEATEEDDQVAAMARHVFAASPLTGKTVAWIGGGFCIGPRLFSIASCKQTVYEIEPALERFCPDGITFIPGDWRDNLTGKFDVIVYDLGGPIPYDILAQHLNPGGIILPKANDGL
jgi:hypothetical protein